MLTSFSQNFCLHYCYWKFIPFPSCILRKACLQVYPEGTHLMIPWFEWPVIYDVRARPHLVESTSGSRDLQMVPVLFFSKLLLELLLLTSVSLFMDYKLK